MADFSVTFTHHDGDDTTVSYDGDARFEIEDSGVLTLRIQDEGDVSVTHVSPLGWRTVNESTRREPGQW